MQVKIVAQGRRSGVGFHWGDTLLPRAGGIALDVSGITMTNGSKFPAQPTQSSNFIMARDSSKRSEKDLLLLKSNLSRYFN